MPAMRRPSRKAEKIAFNIIGVPVNLSRKQTRQQKKKDELVSYQETQLIR